METFSSLLVNIAYLFFVLLLAAIAWGIFQLGFGGVVLFFKRLFKNNELKGGNCPKCGAMLESYSKSKTNDASHVGYLYKCPKCSFEGEEVYKIKFLGHYDNKRHEYIERDEEL